MDDRTGSGDADGRPEQHRKARRVVSAALAVAAVALLAGCGADRSALPAGDEVRSGDNWAFEEVRTFCDHGNRVYHVGGYGYGGGVTVVPADPSCAGAPS